MKCWWWSLVFPSSKSWTRSIATKRTWNKQQEIIIANEWSELFKHNKQPCTRLKQTLKIQHHTFFKKSTIVTWSSHEKVKTKTLKLNNNNIVTHESEGNLFKFNYTHRHKTMKQIIQIQYDKHHHKSVKQTISKFNDLIIIRKWNKPLKFNTTIITRESEPFKFDNNNIIIQEQKKTIWT